MEDRPEARPVVTVVTKARPGRHRDWFEVTAECLSRIFKSLWVSFLVDYPIVASEIGREIPPTVVRVSVAPVAEEEEPGNRSIGRCQLYVMALPEEDTFKLDMKKQDFDPLQYRERAFTLSPSGKEMRADFLLVPKFVNERRKRFALFEMKVEVNGAVVLNHRAKVTSPNSPSRTSIHAKPIQYMQLTPNGCFTYTKEFITPVSDTDPTVGSMGPPPPVDGDHCSSGHFQ